MDISIILPTHNNAPTIERAILSALDQTFKGSYEIVVVCDNCTDETTNIVKALMEDHPNIVMVETCVKGDLRSRMAAFEAASGEYYMFLDGDDWYRDDALEIAYNALRENNAEILSFSVSYVKKKGIKKSKLGKDKIYDRLGAFKALFRDISYRGFMTTKAYSASLVREVGFTYTGGMMVYMDYLYNFLCIAHADKAVSIKDPIYFYNKTNEGSVTNNGKKRIYDNLAMRATIRKYIEELGDKRLLRIFRRQRFRVKTLLMVDFLLASFDDKKEKKRLKKMAKEEMKLIYGKAPMQREGRSYSNTLREIGYSI